MRWSSYVDAEGRVRTAVWQPVPGDRVRLEVDGLGAVDAAVVEGARVRPLRKEDP
jgi:hypothetical protein